jgi:hypothetical protein
MHGMDCRGSRLAGHKDTEGCSRVYRQRSAWERACSLGSLLACGVCGSLVKIEHKRTRLVTKSIITTVRGACMIAQHSLFLAPSPCHTEAPGSSHMSADLPTKLAYYLPHTHPLFTCRCHHVVYACTDIKLGCAAVAVHCSRLASATCPPTCPPSWPTTRPVQQMNTSLTSQVMQTGARGRGGGNITSGMPGQIRCFNLLSPAFQRVCRSG